MMTLCNACGINYRRAVKNEGKFIDLDQLSRDTSCLKLSIQKSIKRQRNLKRAYLDVVRTPKFVATTYPQRISTHSHSHTYSHSTNAQVPSRTRFRPTIKNLCIWSVVL